MAAARSNDVISRLCLLIGAGKEVLLLPLVLLLLRVALLNRQCWLCRVLVLVLVKNMMRVAFLQRCSMQCFEQRGWSKREENAAAAVMILPQFNTNASMI